MTIPATKEDIIRGYITRGWSLVPLNGKKPTLTDWTNLPKTTEAEAESYGRNGNNIGIRTGAISGIAVIDIDPRHGGELALLDLPRTPCVQTGFGGFHYYLRYPKDGLRNSVGKLAPGVDVRADGGQCAAPPSIHPDTGKPYYWIIGPEDCPLAEFPPALLKKLKDPAPTNNGVTAPIESKIIKGQRNETLTSLAGSMRRRGMGEAAIREALLIENRERCEPPLSDGEVAGIAASIGRYEPAGGPGARSSAPQENIGAVLIPLSSVKIERPSWCWKNRIPIGTLTLLDGPPGLGKSTLSFDMAARISTGRPMPDGSPGIEGGVVILSVEDSLSMTIASRLKSAEANLDRIVALTGVKTGKDDLARIPLLTDIKGLGQAVDSVGARLIIIDPLVAYLGRADAHKDQDVRAVLGPLMKFAEERKVAILAIRHLNKSMDSRAIYRGGGSIGLTGAARSVLMVATDPNDPETRVLAGVKMNLSAMPESLTFKLLWDDENQAIYVYWGHGSPLSADQLLAASNAPPIDKSALDEATEFLRELLKAGSQGSKEIQSAAKEAGISIRTLERAKNSMGIRSIRPKGFNGPWEWALSCTPPSKKDTCVDQ